MDNWTWGLSLIALTIAIHAFGVVAMGLVLHRIWLRVSSRRLGLRHVFAILIGLIGTVGLILAVLHGIEAGLWALAYWWLGAIVSPEAAMLYSIDSITTRGASGLALPAHWRTMGALEAVDGMLLFGISTAFIFAVMQTYWPILTTRRS
ncbi:MAG TPA: hypothetical protein VMA53_28910 [Stellaceae bacterium]|nr:hypothetical protein [Stellaceae bacterium]